MDEILTPEQQKEIATHRLEQMRVYKPYITDWKRSNRVTWYDHFIGYYAEDWNGEEAKELKAYIKEHEEKFGDKVYAATHEFTDFGELYTLLVVSKYAEDEQQHELEEIYCGDRKLYRCFAWVWNKTDDWCSEYGYTDIVSLMGGLMRVN